MRKTQNKRTSSSKNGEYHILGRNSDFRKKIGILEFEMSHPGIMYMVSKMYIQNYRWVGTKFGHIRYHLSKYLPTYLLVSCILYDLQNEYIKDVLGR